MSLREKRVANVSVRLERLVRLRLMKAPRWVVRSEQVALVLNSEGLRVSAPGKTFSKRQQELYDKYVIPCLDAQ
jgi:hypothetical protein